MKKLYIRTNGITPYGKILSINSNCLRLFKQIWFHVKRKQKMQFRFEWR